MVSLDEKELLSRDIHIIKNDFLKKNNLKLKYDKLEVIFTNDKNLIAMFPFFDTNNPIIKYNKELNNINSEVENSAIYKYINLNLIDKKFIKKIIHFNNDEFIEEINLLIDKSDGKKNKKLSSKNIFKDLNKRSIYSLKIFTNSKGENVSLLNSEELNENYDIIKITDPHNFIYDISITYKVTKFARDQKRNKIKIDNSRDPFSIRIDKIEVEYLSDAKREEFEISQNLKKISSKELYYSRERLSTLNLLNQSSKNIQKRKSKDYSKGKVCKCFNFIGYSLRLFIILLISIIGIVIYYYFSQNILKGLVILNKNHLKFPTKLYTDEHGLIHIRSANFEDAFFTLGYAQARDRLWQIDFLRRFAKGKLSQILGHKTIKIDKYMRNLGISFRAKNDLNTFYKKKEESFLYGNFNLEDENQKSHEIIKQVEKFIEGVNFYAKNNYLPLEYYILNVKFKRFSILDCFSIGRLMGFLLTFDWHIELFNHVLSITQGREFMEKFDLYNFRNFPFANETVVSAEEIEKMNLNLKNFDFEKIKDFKNYKNEFEFARKQKKIITSENINLNEDLENNKKTIDLAIDNVPLVQTKNEKDDNLNMNMQFSHASNSWVIHGNYTKSGLPIFTNDPHLANRLPPLHYIVKLYIGKPNEQIENIIVGSTFPGLPAILFGCNRNITWGFTTDNRDTVDLIEEYVTPDFKYFIDSEGNVSKTFSRKEKIRIKGDNKQYYKIYHTENGVLLDEYLKETSVFGIYYKHHNINNTYSMKNEKIIINNLTFISALSIRFPSFDLPNQGLNFYHDIIKAKKKEDFMESLEEFTTPVLAFSWATNDNEIGYTSIGKIPLKNYKESKIIFKNSNIKPSDSDLIKYIPFEETPILINPEKGFIISANNEVYAWNYLNYVQSYGYFNRYHRINEIISNKLKDKEYKFSVDDSIEILNDVHDSYVEIILPKLIKIFEANFPNLGEDILQLESYIESINKIETINLDRDLNENDKKDKVVELNEEMDKKINKYGLDLVKIKEYKEKYYLINEFIKKLKSFDYKFFPESDTAAIYSVFEYILGRNLLLKGERNKNVNNESIGFHDENDANGVLNIMNYWNFIVNLVTDISQGNKINLENCNYYLYSKDFKEDYFKDFFFSNFSEENSNCEKYILNSLIYFIDYSKEKNFLDKYNNFIKWGEIHYNYYPHEPFENVEYLRLIFSRKISTGGTRNTIKVSKNKYHHQNPFISAQSANFKFICDLSDITRPYILIDVGNSGNLLSKFYDNFIEKSENNEFVKIKDHDFNDDFNLLISFPEDNTIIIRNPN